MDAALGLGRGYALHAMRAGFELEAGEHAAADDAADHLAVAAVLARALADRLDLPALRFGVAAVHAQQVAGEDRRLVAAGAGADFEKDVALVARIARQQQPLQFAVTGCSRRARMLATSSSPRARMSESASVNMSCAADRSCSSRL